jgi:hypothetical protein
VNTNCSHAHPRAPCLSTRASSRARLTADEAKPWVAVRPLIVFQTHARSIPLVVRIAPSGTYWGVFCVDAALTRAGATLRSAGMGPHKIETSTSA